MANTGHSGDGKRLGPGAERHVDRQFPFELGAPAFVPSVGTLGELLDYWAQARGNLPCAYFIGLDDNVTSLRWSELRDGASRSASALAALGVRAGDRVVLALPTSEQLLMAFFACQWLGALPCIVDAPMQGRGLAGWCERVVPKLALVEPRVLIAERGIVDLVREGLELAGARQEVCGFSLATEREPRHAVAADSPAILQFTSGTTAHPKAVVCSQAATLVNLRCIGGDVRQFYQGDLMVGWLPLFHDMGLVATTLAALAHGIPVALMPPAGFVLRPARWLWVMHVMRGSLAFAPNFAFRLCIRRLPEDDPELVGLDLSSWRIAFNAAEFVHAQTARTFSARFARCGLPKHAMTPAYGMAEMVVGVSTHERGTPLRVDVISRAALGQEGRARKTEYGSSDALELVSVGRVFGGHVLEIHDDQGQPLAERCQGEIVLRGPSLFDGYFRDAAATAEVMHSGWLRTGDLGYLSGGELYITGRSKDLIIRGGENHHPHLLEDAACTVPGVRAGRVAAVGLMNPSAGTEEVALLVETIETNPEARRRIQHEIEKTVHRISGLRPDHVVLVGPNKVPVTTSGKIRRGSARELILQQLGKATPQTAGDRGAFPVEP
jgi:fatty-acyl-CoA synthase